MSRAAGLSLIFLASLLTAPALLTVNANAQPAYEIDEGELSAFFDEAKEAVPQAKQGVKTTHSLISHLVKAIVPGIDEMILNTVVIILTFVVVLTIAMKISNHAFKIIFIMLLIGVGGFMLFPFQSET